MRRARILIIKIVASILILFALVYLLFSNPDAHARAKQAISARFVASARREKPVLVKGQYTDGDVQSANRDIYQINSVFDFRTGKFRTDA